MSIKILSLLTLLLFSNASYAQDTWQVLQRPNDLAQNPLVGNPNVLPGDPNLYYTSEAGVFVSSDRGATWRNMSITLNDKLIWRIYRTHSSTMLATLGGNEGIRVSTDDGAIWQSVPTLNGMPVQEIAEHSNKTLVAAVRGPVAMRSIDGGLTWEASVSGLPQEHWGQAIRTLSNSDILLSTGFNGEYGIYRSTDAGITWKPSNSGLENTYVLTFAVGLDGTVYAGTQNNGVFRSTNNGNTWNAFNTGLPTNAEEVESIAMANDGSVLISTEGEGIWRWAESGPWQNTGPGAGNYINRIAVDRAGFVYAGSERGLVRSDFTTGVNSVASKVSRSLRIYPNPAASHLWLEEAGSQHYEIVDAIGRIVDAGILDEAGRLDILHLPSGVYTITLDMGRRERFIKE